YVAFGDLPSRQSFAGRGIRPSSANQSVSLAGSQAGNYYIEVFGAQVPSPENFMITASPMGFSIGGVEPVQGSNTGQVALTITGARVDVSTRLRLIDSGGGTITPSQVYFTDSGTISATFDLTGHPAGPADVQVVNTGNATTTLPHGFNIIVGKPGQLVTSVSV